jgi:serine/threonine-protein kinase
MAPELVTGGSATKATDVYACGIMLYEMLTGTRPYVGEQNVQIAYQHAHSRVPAPSRSNPEISVGLDRLVLLSTEPNPSDRPQDAASLLKAVKQFETLLPDNRTTVLNPIVGSGDATEVISPIEREAIAEPFGAIPTRKKLVPFLVWSTIAVLLGSLGGWWFAAGPGALSPVPELTKRSLTEAEVALSPLELKIIIANENSKLVPAGFITRTDPPAGGYVARGGTLTIYLSDGPKLIVVPDLKDKNLADATTTLVTAGFVLGTVDSVFSATALGNIVEHTGSDGLAIAEGSSINLKVSLGSIPAISGLSLNAATAALNLVGLEVGKLTESYSDDVPKGNVIDLAPNQLNLSKGSKVDLNVSKGTNKVKVPNVVGQRILAAQDILKNLGLKVLVDTNLPNSQWGLKNVKSTNPVAGTEVRVGDTVTLVARY